MSNVLSLYFDGTIVQVLKVSVSRGAVTIGEARTFLQSELDDYLAGCREKKCVISYNPATFNQTIVSLPPAAGRHTDQLIAIDLKKYHPDSDYFVFFHRTLGEMTSDAKTYHKFALFSYDDAPLDELISIFNRHNKVVSSIVASPYSIFRLVSSAVSQQNINDARMFIVSLPGEKMCLLSENGELAFIRKISSPDAVLQQEDLDSITMTVSYCLQSLRIKPSQLALVNLPSRGVEDPQSFPVPLDMGYDLSIPGVVDEILHDYLAPLATAIHCLEAPRAGDLRPSYYRAFQRDKKAFTHGITLMVIISMIMALFALSRQLVISDATSRIIALRRTLGSSGEEIKAYRKLDDEIKKLGQSIELVNRHNQSLDPATALASFTLPSSQDYAIKEISVQKGDGFATVRVKGSINASTFGATQALFEGIVASAGKMSGYAVTSSSVDVKLKTFMLEMRYSSNSQPVKK